MSYDDATARFSAYVDTGAVPNPLIAASPARLLRDAIEPIAMHSVWSRTVSAALTDLGLDFFTAYVWGRAAALGTPQPGLVVASFAVFDPMMLTDGYERGRAAVDRSEMLAVRQAVTVESLRSVLHEVSDDDIAEVADVLQVAASTADGTGRPLFAGLMGEPWPADPVGRLWRACELLREHRGDSHVAVNVAHGVSPIEMNILTELWVGMPLYSYSVTRGWSLEALADTTKHLQAIGILDTADLTEAGRDIRTQIEADTDAIGQSVIDTIGDSLATVLPQLTEWSQLCIDAGSFPPDPFKRAAG